MSFSLDIAKFAKKANESLYNTSKTIKIDLFSGVISDTRVGNSAYWKHPVKNYIGGRLKNNWQTTTGSPATGTKDKPDASGDEATAEVKRVVKGDTVDYLTNNLPYAAVYEEKDGMVEKGMTRIKRIVRAAT